MPTEAQKRAIKKWNEANRSQIRIIPKKEDAALIREYCKTNGLSITEYMVRATKKFIEDGVL